MDETAAQKKPLLVGEANPYGGDPRFALYPKPEHSAGGRLCWLILRMSVKEYISTFERVNLCPEKWSVKTARLTAAGFKDQAHAGRRLILFGSKVAGAFDYAFFPFTVHHYGAGRIAILPHPSGLNRLWNVPGAFENARRIIALTLKEAVE